MVVGSRLVLRKRVGEVFKFFTRLENIASLYPPEMRVKILEGGEELAEGSTFRLRFTMLGQRQEATFRVTEYRPNETIKIEAVSSPMRRWSHEHRFKEEDGSTVLEDRVEISTYLGPLGDVAAGRLVRSILQYRDMALKRILEGSGEGPVYRDPTKIGLAGGTALVLAGTLAGLFLLFLVPTGSVLVDSLLGLASFFLLWFFIHDLAHLAVGLAAGVRFSHYYVGLSNLSRLLPERLKAIPIALGIRIDRRASRAGRWGFFAMYLAGPLASMLLPLVVPLTLYLKQAPPTSTTLLATVALANIAFTVFFSPRAGCIGKALRSLRR